MLISLVLFILAVNCWTGCPWNRRNRKEVGGRQVCQDLFEVETSASFCKPKVVSQCLQDFMLGYVIKLLSTPTKEHRATMAGPQITIHPSCFQAHLRTTSSSKTHHTCPNELWGRTSGRISNEGHLKNKLPCHGSRRAVPGVCPSTHPAWNSPLVAIRRTPGGFFQLKWVAAQGWGMHCGCRGKAAWDPTGFIMGYLWGEPKVAKKGV